jgi:DNA-binding GntR family transcriptional regulator
MGDFIGLDGGKRQHRYLLIANSLLKDISDGVYPVGSMLPGELDLCERFGVSRHTVREAIRSLSEKGLVYRHQGVGTLVKAGQVESHYIQEMGSLSDLSRYAEKTRLKILKNEEFRAEGETQKFLGCKAGEVWLRVEGTRFGSDPKGLAIAHTTIYLPPAFSGILNLIGNGKEPVYTLIEKHYSESVVDVQQEISAVSISE